MVVQCINQTCGEISFEDKYHDTNLVQNAANSTKKLVKTMLRPHFHCSTRPANMDNVKHHIHPALSALWNEAEEWHLLASDHCDVYGFNVWSPAWLEESTDMVFDGPDGRKKWAVEHKGKVADERGQVSRLESCASRGWVCCMAFSEFDYLVICLAANKVNYGNVHHINTRTGKESYCCTMDDLLLHLAYFVREAKERKMAEDNPMMKCTTKPRPGISRPLKMLRRSIIDALMR
mmetsp:Transcript_1174/g.2123  ORF Transcript_1174/g.2123 Transcript_1174/m.2123 type:complete len:234 (-) Transcript_1174:189-890(-)